MGNRVRAVHLPWGPGPAFVGVVEDVETKKQVARCTHRHRSERTARSCAQKMWANMERNVSPFEIDPDDEP